MLVVSADQGLGRRLRHLLGELSQHQVTIICQADEVLEWLGRGATAAVIVDAQLGEWVWRRLIVQLRRDHPDIHRVVVLPEQSTYQRDLSRIGVDDYLLQPVLLSDLRQALNHIVVHGNQPGLAETPATHIAQSPPRKTGEYHPGPVIDYTWLADLAAARRALDGFALGPEVHAVLLLQATVLWAWSGNLAPDIYNELAQEATRIWNSSDRQGEIRAIQPRSGLVHYVNIQGKGSFLLYIFSLDTTWLIAIVLPENSPLRIARQAADQVAAGLVEPLNGSAGVEANRPAANIPEEKGAGAPWLGHDPETAAAGVQTNLALEDRLSEEWLLHDERNPDPWPVKIFPLEEQPDPDASDPSTPAAPQEQTVWEWSVLPRVQEAGAEEGDQIVNDISEPEASSSTLTDQASPRTDNLIEIVAADQFVAYYRIEYACVLLPRMPNHQLLDPLKGWLPEVLHRLGIAFGWRFTFLEIQPDYLQWIASVPPHTSAEEVVQTIRRQLSERLFARFPDLGAENPSGDFWAPGYLVMSGGETVPAVVIQKYLEQTRRQQEWTD